MRSPANRNRIPTSLLLLTAALALAGVTLFGAAPALAQAARVTDLQYPPLPPFDLPQPQRIELANGMVVMLLEDHELPLIDATALIRTGARLESAGKLGLSELTGTVLRSGGTERLRADELDDYLEGKAAAIETSIDAETGRASLSSLKEDFPEVLRVFADVLRRPAFAEDRLAIAKVQSRSRLARQNDSPMGILFRELRKVVYGQESPYARIPTGATLDAITRDDLVAWHRAYFQPQNVILGIVGDFDPKEVRRLVEASFGDWPRGAAGKAELPKVGGGPRPGIYWGEKSDVNQSNIAFGDLGIERTDPDYFAVEVMNQVLSGGMSARLSSNVRTKKGLAYAVFGQVGSDWDHPGMTMMIMTTKTATTGAGIDAMLEEARGMTTSPPSEEEVTKAKAAILNSHVFNSDSRRKVLNQQLRAEYYGYPLDWIERYRKGIEATTVEQTRAAAVKYLKPERFAIVVVGPKEGLDKPLASFGPVTPLTLESFGAPARAASSR